MSLWIHFSGLIQYIWDVTLYISRISDYKISNTVLFLSLKVFFDVLANGADFDEMSHSVTLHLYAELSVYRCLVYKDLEMF